MRAVVLVGGFGTRLRPLTHHRPKQMLPIVNRPMIEHVVGHLVVHGVDDVVLSLGYQPDGFRDAYPSGRCAGASLHYAIEPEPLDTAGAIRFAALDAAIDERFVVVNGDVLTDLDVTAFVAFHVARAAEATISLHRVDDPSRYGVVLTDAQGRVSAFVEKPPRGQAASDLINAGTYVLEPSVIDRIPPGRRVSIERETFPAMAADGSLYARADGCYWIDTGTPCEYIQAQLDLVDGVRGAAIDGVHPDARIAADAAVEHSVVGAGAVVSGGARVEHSVLLPRVRVCSAAVVDGSVVGEGAIVAEGAHVLCGSVVGDGEVVGRGAHLAGERVPESDAWGVKA
ncbi:MAG TPA: NDP-sugar synthase [Acidimicrobiales bacterium]|nr:NDP-sugar synthase [Acidimicrobiales bacterium]